MIDKFKNVQITENDIECGIRGDMKNCAIAKALKREIHSSSNKSEDIVVEVHSGVAEIYNYNCGLYPRLSTERDFTLSIKLDDDICEWIEEYDEEDLEQLPIGSYVVSKPFTIELDWKGDFNADGKYII